MKKILYTTIMLFLIIGLVSCGSKDSNIDTPEQPGPELPGPELPGPELPGPEQPDPEHPNPDPENPGPEFPEDETPIVPEIIEEEDEQGYIRYKLLNTFEISLHKSYKFASYATVEDGGSLLYEIVPINPIGTVEFFDSLVIGLEANLDEYEPLSIKNKEEFDNSMEEESSDDVDRYASGFVSKENNINLFYSEIYYIPKPTDEPTYYSGHTYDMKYKESYLFVDFVFYDKARASYEKTLEFVKDIKF
ncbi:MAG: hypothetical protein ACRC5M_01945 [Anaeroplasmataceae bacterium]